MNASPRQRRLIASRIAEANGVFDLSGAQSGIVEPPAQPTTHAQPQGQQQPLLPKVPKPKSLTQVNDTQQKVSNLIMGGDLLSDVSAKLEAATAYIRKSDSGIAEELDKTRSLLMSCSGGIREKLVDIAQKDPSVAAQIKEWLISGQTNDQDLELPTPQPAPQPPAPQPPAPQPPAPQPPAPQLSQPSTSTQTLPQQTLPQQTTPTPINTESFIDRLSMVLESGVTKERNKTSQECDSAIQVSQHQGPKSGNPPKKHKSVADFAVKPVKGNGYGSKNGFG